MIPGGVIQLESRTPEQGERAAAICGRCSISREASPMLLVEGTASRSDLHFHWLRRDDARSGRGDRQELRGPCWR
jgi:hypothetical protein